ncbi:hypothetical protein [Enterococcus sp. DIV0660C]|uniref:hypothetical protein n=1 Tax=Enterococcus sp. DIV0660C TaxID=2230880 RepID=UPI001A8F17C6|nr:hypothetical protein [Enterococcus sp. DIV0660C]
MFVIWGEIKEKIQESWIEFADAFAENPVKYFWRVGGLLFLAVLLAGSMIFLPEKIKADQVDSLVYSTITSDKVKRFDYSNAKQTITDSKAISVMFCVPKGKNYEQVLTILNDSKKMEELNRQIYFYPLVYDVAKEEKEYGINREQITFIFFDGGKETNRVVIGADGITDVSNELVPELNRLPLANIKKLELEMTTDSTQ